MREKYSRLEGVWMFWEEECRYLSTTCLHFKTSNGCFRRLMYGSTVTFGSALIIRPINLPDWYIGQLDLIADLSEVLYTSAVSLNYTDYTEILKKHCLHYIVCLTENTAWFIFWLQNILHCKYLLDGHNLKKKIPVLNVSLVGSCWSKGQ